MQNGRIKGRLEAAYLPMQRSDGATLLAIRVGEGRQWSRGWNL